MVLLKHRQTVGAEELRPNALHPTEAPDLTKQGRQLLFA